MLKNIKFTCQLFQEDGQMVSYCPEFNVSSFGDNPEEATASLYEAMSLFLKECERMGTLDEVLEDAGYRQVRPQKQPPLVQRWLPPRPLRVRSLEVSLA